MNTTNKSLVEYVSLIIFLLIIGIFWLVSRGLVINRDCTIVLDREQAKMHTIQSQVFHYLQDYRWLHYTFLVLNFQVETPAGKISKFQPYRIAYLKWIIKWIDENK